MPVLNFGWNFLVVPIVVVFMLALVLVDTLVTYCLHKINSQPSKDE